MNTNGNSAIDESIQQQQQQQKSIFENELSKLANEVSTTFGKFNLDNNEETTNFKSINNNDDELTGISLPAPATATSEKNHNNKQEELLMSDNESEIDFDNECLLPEFDWANLEAKLKETQNEINKQNHNDRDEIKRKLAHLSNENSTDNADDYIPDYLRKGLVNKSHIGQNLQICFMNESISDCEYSNESDKELQDSPKIKDKRIHKQFQNSSILYKQLLSNSSSLSPLSSISNGNGNNHSSSSECTNDTEDFLTKQLKLQHEMKQALVNAQQEAKLAIEKEKKAKKPSPIADIVGLPTYGLKRLERRMFANMNIGQLQVIINDMCNQIENTNEELKKLLIERDDYYMQQDSILVDIEDLTKRLQEYNRKLGLAELKSPQTQLNNSKSSINKSNSNSQNSSINNQSKFYETAINSTINTLNNSGSNLMNLNKNIINSFTNKFYKLTKKTS